MSQAEYDIIFNLVLTICHCCPEINHTQSNVRMWGCGSLYRNYSAHNGLVVSQSRALQISIIRIFRKQSTTAILFQPKWQQTTIGGKKFKFSAGKRGGWSSVSSFLFNLSKLNHHLRWDDDESVRSILRACDQLFIVPNHHCRHWYAKVAQAHALPA